MSEPVTWGDLVVAARRKAAAVASEIRADQRTQDALNLASAGAAAAARRLDPALRAIGVPDGALTDEVATAVDELVEVVLVQQDLIENLLLRMSRTEARLAHLENGYGVEEAAG
jgi:hypothetical protein